MPQTAAYRLPQDEENTDLSWTALLPAPCVLVFMTLECSTPIRSSGSVIP